MIYKAFSILFNDIRLCGVPETVAAEPFAFSPITLFNERSRGVQILVGVCIFGKKGVHILIIPQERKRKAAKPVRPKYERPCDLVSYSPTLTSVPFLKTKVIAPFLWPIAFSTITVQMVSLHSRSTTGCFLRVRM